MRPWLGLGAGWKWWPLLIRNLLHIQIADIFVMINQRAFIQSWWTNLVNNNGTYTYLYCVHAVKFNGRADGSRVLRMLRCSRTESLIWDLLIFICWKNKVRANVFTDSVLRTLEGTWRSTRVVFLNSRPTYSSFVSFAWFPSCSDLELRWLYLHRRRVVGYINGKWMEGMICLSSIEFCFGHAHVEVTN